jgi:hypothetical protein
MANMCSICLAIVSTASSCNFYLEQVLWWQAVFGGGVGGGGGSGGYVLHFSLAK